MNRGSFSSLLRWSGVRCVLVRNLPAHRVLPWNSRGFRGRVELDLEDERADFHEVAVGQGTLLDDTDPIDEGAIAATQIAQRDGLGRDAQQAMLAADPVAVGTDVAFRTAPKQVFAVLENELLTVWPSLDQAQSDEHGDFLLPDAAPA